MAAIGAIALWAGYATSIYPNERVIDWFEVCTDGVAPDWLARDAQHILSSLWTDGFDAGLINEKLSKTLGGYLRTSNKTADVIELAAGHGAAPAKWDEIFRRDEQVVARMVLTDLQPDV